MATTSQKERQQLKDFQSLSVLAAEKGISVRRENLARGHSYRVKSGECVFSGENLVFVDKRLPIEQQLGVLIDYLIENGIELDSDQLQPLSAGTQKLLHFDLLAEAV